MSSIDAAVRGARTLESLLEARYGASGKGLHEKLSSVERQLSPELVRSIRYIATVRNNAVHQDGFEIDDPERFRASVKRAVRALGGEAGSRGGPRSQPKRSGSPPSALERNWEHRRSRRRRGVPGRRDAIMGWSALAVLILIGVLLMSAMRTADKRTNRAGHIGAATRGK